MYRPVLVTPPAIKPLTLAEVKAQLRVDHDDQDALIGGLIAAATDHFDGWTGILRRCLCEQEWRIDYDGFDRCMRLPLFPLITVTSLVYRDLAGDEQTVAAQSFALRTDDRGSFVRFADEFSRPPLARGGAAVSLTARFGYPDIPGVGEAPATSSVPDAIKHALRLLIGHWYENREAVAMAAGGSAPVVLPMGVQALIDPYRRRTL